MLVTLAGMLTLVKPLHDANAESPMLVTLSGMLTLVNPLQNENAQSPMPDHRLAVYGSRDYYSSAGT